MYPAGPRTPALWQTFQFLLRPRPYIREIRARYGDVASFDSLFGRGIAVMDPTLAREVFATPAESFEVIDSVRGLFGSQAVIATTGAVHKRQRKLLNPPFHGPRIKALFATMKRVVDEHLAPLGNAGRNDVIVMTTITQALTLDVILETVFGSGAERGDLERVARYSARSSTISPRRSSRRPSCTRRSFRRGGATKLRVSISTVGCRRSSASGDRAGSWVKTCSVYFSPRNTTTVSR